MDSCLKAMLRKCFPPFTFHVPTKIRNLLTSVKSSKLDTMECRIAAGAERGMILLYISKKCKIE